MVYNQLGEMVGFLITVFFTKVFSNHADMHSHAGNLYFNISLGRWIKKLGISRIINFYKCYWTN